VPRRQQIAPAFAFCLQLLVENLQHIVLKIAALPRIQFKNLPLVRAQAGPDEKLEGTLRELLQPTYRRAQDRTVEFFRQRGRKIFLFIRLAQHGQLFREGFQRRKFEQAYPINTRRRRREEPLTSL
jgi:hypothetical protein